MYLTIKQHDMFRTLLMGFEIPYRAYISKKVITSYVNDDAFDLEMRNRQKALTSSSPSFLKSTLTKACKQNKLKTAYQLFSTAATSTEEIVSEDKDMPMVGALNLATFALVDDFKELYSLFSGYSDFCTLAEKYRYARNKLDHPRCRTLEESHLVPVLSFVKDICIFLDEEYFLEKTKEVILKEVNALQQRKIEIPIEKHNLSDMPYGESKVVCRDPEIAILKSFVYGDPNDVRKPHSFCVYGYGGVGKTALVLEAVKQIVQDIIDGIVINEYAPEYIYFFSAKKRKLSLAQATGKVIEQQIRWHFQTADELIESIQQVLGCDSFRKYHKEGLIIVDNLESLSEDDRVKVKRFIDTKTPAEMQFIVTSRHSEDYDTNYKLAGFEFEAGNEFVTTYTEENTLELSLNPKEIDELLSLSKGNTLVLVLCLRRLSQHLSTINNLKSDFSSVNTWKSLRQSLTQIPQNAYEVISEFMFKDTFEQIEKVFSTDISLFYQILKIFAVSPNEDIDINTICLLTDNPYPLVESTIDTLCNYLILEKKSGKYSLNAFAEKYIIGRFLPDAETYNKLSAEIIHRRRQIRDSLEQLELDKRDRPDLANILRDWSIITDGDRITAARVYRLYGQVKNACNGTKFSMQGAMETFIHECNEAERITAHPYVKYQKARILQMVDRSNILTEKHVAEILAAYNSAIYVIKTIDQYAAIQQTKSYASTLWLYGQYLSETGDISAAIRYLEEGKGSFESQHINDQQYYQCCSKLGSLYLDYYLEDRVTRVSYLRRARQISRFLQDNYAYLGKARTYAQQLKARLVQYGEY